jgi:hypothetical protein
MLQTPGLDSSTYTPISGRPAIIKEGKVFSVHRDDQSVDVAFLDGSLARHVPVLSGALSTTSGFAHLIAPVYDKEIRQRKTYPDSTNELVQPPWNQSKKGRDIYAVILQSDGHGFGVGNGYVVGFYAPQVSEMMFPPGEGNEFSDLMLFRHPSDVQVTVDHDGKISIQHPAGSQGPPTHAGSRITIGEDFRGVSLRHRDYDNLYELRHNLKLWASVYAETIGPVHHGDAQEIKDSLVLRTDGDTIEYGKIQVFLYNKLKSTVWCETSPDGDYDDAGGDKKGHVTIYAPDDIKIYNKVGSYIWLKEDGDVEIYAKRDLLMFSGRDTSVQATRDLSLCAENDAELYATKDLYVHSGLRTILDDTFDDFASEFPPIYCEHPTPHHFNEPHVPPFQNPVTGKTEVLPPGPAGSIQYMSENDFAKAQPFIDARIPLPLEIHPPGPAGTIQYMSPEDFAAVQPYLDSEIPIAAEVV